MSVIKRLYKEVLELTNFGTSPQDVFNTIVGAGNIIYGYMEGEDVDVMEVRDFIRKHTINDIGVHPTIAQLYFLYFKSNLDILASIPEASLSYDIERALPLYSFWVNVPDVVSFYKRFAPKKFTNSINFSKSRS